MPFQRLDREHRGVTRRPDGHCLFRRECGRQRNQPVRVEPRLLRQPSAMRLANTPAVQDHRSACRTRRRCARLDDTCAIDARGQRKLADHRRASGDRERVLVVDRRVLDANGDVAVRQVRFIEAGQRAAITGVVLLDLQCIEH